MARVATTYRIEYSRPIRMWRTSFKTALFRFGLQHRDISYEDNEMTKFYTGPLYECRDRMREADQNYKITDTVTVGGVLRALEQVLDLQDKGIIEVVIKWD